MESIQEQVTTSIIKQMEKKLNDILIEGLKLKGFEFENKVVLTTFISENCRCEDNQETKTKTYFANDVPFLVHHYKNDIYLAENENSLFVSINADYGTFQYV